MGIPHKPTTEGHPAITRLQYDYFLQEFEAGMNVDETAFRFETDNQDILRYIGYSGNEEPYWAGLSDLPDGGRFKTANELLRQKFMMVNLSRKDGVRSTFIVFILCLWMTG